MIIFSIGALIILSLPSPLHVILPFFSSDFHPPQFPTSSISHTLLYLPSPTPSCSPTPSLSHLLTQSMFRISSSTHKHLPTPTPQQSWSHLCCIEDLVFVTTRSQDLTVEVSRKTGIPCYFKLSTTEELESFVGCLTGYVCCLGDAVYIWERYVCMCKYVYLGSHLCMYWKHFIGSLTRYVYSERVLCICREMYTMDENVCCFGRNIEKNVYNV